MDISNLSFGQRVDPENGYVQCWFTHPALDELISMDLSDKVVWVWGAGRGDLWLSKRCKKLYVVEREQEWIYKNVEIQQANGVDNVEYLYRPCSEGDVTKYEYYTEIPEGIRPDVIIVDDIMRYECILKALEYKPCILIVDNWQQDYVFLCPAAEEALKDYTNHVHIQVDHKDHSGNPWKTLIGYIK